jgi:hypothetical protein
MAKKTTHPDVIPWRKVPRDKLDRFIELYSDQEALKQRLFHGFPSRSENLDCVDVAEWLWRIENPSEWANPEPPLSEVQGVEHPSQEVVLRGYKQRLAYTLLNWALEKRHRELKWLRGYIEEYSGRSFPRIQVIETSSHPNPTTFNEVVLSEFFKISGLCIFPYAHEKRPFVLPTKAHLKVLVHARWESLEHEVDSIEKEFSEALTLFGLGGLPQARTKPDLRDSIFTW